MKLFQRKKKISSLVMMHLIYETTKSEVLNVFPLLDKLGIIYDNNQVKINFVVINYELCRQELYKANNKDIVDSTMEKVYNQLFYDIDEKEDKLNEYRNIINYIQNCIKELYSNKKLVKMKEEYIYHLFLQQLNVNEQIIEQFYIKEFHLYIKKWILDAVSINKAYNLDEKSDKKEYIDFRF